MTSHETLLSCLFPPAHTAHTPVAQPHLFSLLFFYYRVCLDMSLSSLLLLVWCCCCCLSLPFLLPLSCILSHGFCDIFMPGRHVVCWSACIPPAHPICIPAHPHLLTTYPLIPLPSPLYYKIAYFHPFIYIAWLNERHFCAGVMACVFAYIQALRAAAGRAARHGRRARRRWEKALAAATCSRALLMPAAAYPTFGIFAGMNAYALPTYRRTGFRFRFETLSFGFVLYVRAFSRVPLRTATTTLHHCTLPPCTRMHARAHHTTTHTTTATPRTRLARVGFPCPALPATTYHYHHPLPASHYTHHRHTCLPGSMALVGIATIFPTTMPLSCCPLPRLHAFPALLPALLPTLCKRHAQPLLAFSPFSPCF